jgi:hypothetical protein
MPHAPGARRRTQSTSGGDAHSRNTPAALLARPDVRRQVLQTSAAWLNLIEPWWTLLNALALQGRRFATVVDLETAVRGALTYWTAHRHPFTWHTRPPHPPTPSAPTTRHTDRAEPRELGEKTT